MFSWLNHWLRSWFGICLLKRAPQDDPASYSGLVLALSLYVISDLVVAGTSSGWKVAWGMTAIDLLVMIVLTVVLLQFTHKSTRFLQTLTALAGTGGLLGLLVLPAVLSVSANHQAQQSSALLVIFWLVMMVWSIVVRAHVYRHALSLNYATGVGVAIVQAVIVLKLVDHWFPQVG